MRSTSPRRSVNVRPTGKSLIAAEHLERRSEDDAAEVAAGLQRRAGQADFQGGGVRRIADQGVAERKRPAVRGPADRHAEAAARSAGRNRPPGFASRVRERGGSCERLDRETGARSRRRAGRGQTRPLAGCRRGRRGCGRRFLGEPKRLLGRLGGVVDEGVRLGPRHQAAVGPIAAVGEALGDETAVGSGLATANSAGP